MPAPFRIIKFYTKYITRNGKTVPEDMVEYCAIGQAQRTTTPAYISQLRRVRSDFDADDVAGRLAFERWEAIRPAYEAWKKGQEIPDSGHPLGAWPGITPEQADVLRTAGLRSVEDVAAASDGVMSRVQLPNARGLRDLAAKFLEARDAQKVADRMSERDLEVLTLKEQLEEMRQLMLAQQSAEDEDEAPRRRGRPPKQPQPEAA